MKKLLFALALLIGSISISHGKTIDQIFEVFGAEENAQLMTLDEEMLAASKAQAGEDAAKLENIESITVLELSQCDASVLARFEEEVANVQLAGYEVLTRVNMDDMAVKMLGKVDGDMVRDMIIIVTGETAVMVEMKGSISMSDVNELMKNMQ